jgi:hypothetical protein
LLIDALQCCWARETCAMMHKRIQFTIEEAAEVGAWIWEYKIRAQAKSGRIVAAFRELAIRSVRQKIDRDLRDLHLQRERE